MFIGTFAIWDRNFDMMKMCISTSLKHYILWLAFFIDMVIPAFVDKEDALPDAILNYFEPIFIGYGYEMEERGNLRNRSYKERSGPLHWMR